MDNSRDKPKPPAHVWLAGTHTHDAKNYTLVNELYVAEEGETFPLSKLDEVIEGCIEQHRNFVLVFSSKLPSIH